MKIGILTFHNAYNYGAILQTYATQEIIRGMGYEVEVIDYHNKAIDDAYNKRKFHYSTLPKKKFWNIPKYLLEKYFYFKRRKAYKSFIQQYINLSRKRYEQGDNIVINGYDIILIGSDQLWNKNITNGFDRVYWGDFRTDANTQKVAWSVCMNQTDINEDEKRYIIEHLNNFSSISVREDSTKTMLSKFTNKKIIHTLDPTLVLSPKKWESLCYKVKEKHYIAVYAVRNERETINFARKVSEYLNKPLIIIRSYSKWYTSKENKECGGPLEFLSYIKNADYVVSTSFHGTVFSIIFEKQFVCPIFDNNIRTQSLLEIYGLQDRLIFALNDKSLPPMIDYGKISLENVQRNTLSFLKQIVT